MGEVSLFWGASRQDWPKCLLKWLGLVKHFCGSDWDLTKYFCRGTNDWSNLWQWMGMKKKLRSRPDWTNCLQERSGLGQNFCRSRWHWSVFLWEQVRLDSHFVVREGLGQTICGSGQDWSIFFLQKWIELVNSFCRSETKGYSCVHLSFQSLV